MLLGETADHAAASFEDTIKEMRQGSEVMVFHELGNPIDDHEVGRGPALVNTVEALARCRIEIAAESFGINKQEPPRTTGWVAVEAFPVMSDLLEHGRRRSGGANQYQRAVVTRLISE
jgi:hypothetical protein